MPLLRLCPPHWTRREPAKIGVVLRRRNPGLVDVFGISCAGISLAGAFVCRRSLR